jgi:4-hydroxybenzoate polyprenyltransferase
MLPGVVFAFYDAPNLASWGTIAQLFLGLAATCLVASSNYTINEIIDAPMDALHPVKKLRPVPLGLVKPGIGYAQWFVLALFGLLIAWTINIYFFGTLVFLLVMGLVYNVPPVRTKELPYLDVISESVNNPIRLMLGWFCVNQEHFPTLSLVLAYWMIGAFFMTVKRYAEYKKIDDPTLAEQYRKSFSYYNEYRLILSMVYYASAFSLFFGIFLIRYRIELVMSIPFMAGFIPVYMRLAFWENSPAQYPELLYKQRGLVLYSTFCAVLLMSLLFIDLPFLTQIFQPMHMPGR